METPIGSMDTPSMIAYKGTFAKFEQLLKDQPTTSLIAKDEDKRTPLHWASAGGNLPILQFLLQQEEVKGKCLNVQDESGNTPLISAVSGGHIEAVRALLAAGANANKVNEQGCTALHYHKGKVQMIEELLPHMKDINARDELGVTPLHRAAGPGYLDAVRALIVAGANVNVTVGHGDTALHYACEEGRAEVVALLIDNGARADIKNSEGKTAQDLIPRADAASGNRVRNTLSGALGRA